ncbi:EF-P 5-aminopentanol modification-associated protein YfmH [Dubosiella newyorkensis]|uniref:EF-P 5-aminopentanol modification-associated protein YfmH n=1 Tax=Dubosiella newyorkensis TaxID=1862672 RepID=UPI00248C7B8C|nr:pitrilysin family protein [Dubosiella newyorkensis]
MFNLAFQTKKLKNGALVILIQKPDYVQSLFMCGFGVGGFNIKERSENMVYENKGGCAHYLEHQMFRYQGEDVTDLFARMQAQTNAFTSYSETAYYFYTTSEIEKPLQLLLDFVQNLDINAESVEKERGIIASEFAMYEQNPEMRLIKELLVSMYKNHPLKVDILGSLDDIESIQLEDLASFYRRNYDPKNMVIVGVTGKNLDEVLKEIERIEEKYPSKIGERAVCIFPDEPKEVARSKYSLEMDVVQPYVGIAFKLERKENIIDCLLYDLAFSIWLDAIFGPSNPKYQTWIDEKIITQICGAEVDFSQDHAYLMFYAQTEKIEEFKKLVDSLVQNREKIDPIVFESLKHQSQARNIRLLDRFEGLAVEVLRAHINRYDFLESLQLIDSLDTDKVFEILSSVDFSQKAEVMILPS